MLGPLRFRSNCLGAVCQSDVDAKATCFPSLGGVFRTAAANTSCVLHFKTRVCFQSFASCFHCPPNAVKHVCVRLYFPALFLEIVLCKRDIATLCCKCTPQHVEAVHGKSSDGGNMQRQQDCKVKTTATPRPCGKISLKPFRPEFKDPLKSARC